MKAITKPTPLNALTSRRRLDILLRTHDLDLDSTRARVRSRLERLDGIFQLVAVRHQLPQINNPVLHQTNSARPGVGVPVLVLKVDLLGAQTHEGNLHFILANTNHKHLAAEFHTPDGGRHTALHTCAFQRKTGSQSIRGRAIAIVDSVDDPLGIVLCRQTGLHLVCTDLWCQGLGELQPPLVDIRDDNGGSTGGAGTQERDETNGARAGNQTRVTQTKTTALDGGQGHTERLQQGTVLETHVSNLVAPDGGVVDVAAEQTVDWGSGEEEHVFTTVVPSRQAGFAGVADDVGLDGHPVAHTEGLHIGANGDDLTGRFVTKDVVSGDNHRTDAAFVPEVNVRSKGQLSDIRCIHVISGR